MPPQTNQATRTVHLTLTVHASTEGVALKQAEEDVDARFKAVMNGGPITRWDVTETAVEEYPVAPFEPFQIAVSVALAVAGNGGDADGVDALIRSTLDDAEFDRWELAN